MFNIFKILGAAKCMIGVIRQPHAMDSSGTCPTLYHSSGNAMAELLTAVRYNLLILQFI